MKTPAEIVELQAADLRLWLPAQTPIEAYLQHALWVLHAAIEEEDVGTFLHTEAKP